MTYAVPDCSILSALDMYSRTAYLGDDDHTRIVYPNLAIDLLNVAEDTDITGFGARSDREELSPDGLFYYTTNTMGNGVFDDVASSIRYPALVLDIAKDALSMFINIYLHMHLFMEYLSIIYNI